MYSALVFDGSISRAPGACPLLSANPHIQFPSTNGWHSTCTCNLQSECVCLFTGTFGLPVHLQTFRCVSNSHLSLLALDKNVFPLFFMSLVINKNLYTSFKSVTAPSRKPRWLSPGHLLGTLPSCSHLSDPTILQCTSWWPFSCHLSYLCPCYTHSCNFMTRCHTFPIQMKERLMLSCKALRTFCTGLQLPRSTHPTNRDVYSTHEGWDTPQSPLGIRKVRFRHHWGPLGVDTSHIVLEIPLTSWIAVIDGFVVLRYLHLQVFPR